MKLSLELSPRDYSVAGGAVAYDADAQAYFSANTSITSAADKNAINSFYLGLKSDGIYTKIKAMYLPIWGSASACKWNLVNPLDTNGAFRLIFSTGWTFSSSGITPTNAYADTFLNPNTNFTSDIHMSFYSQTSNIGIMSEMGSSQVIGGGTTYSYLRIAVNTIYGITINGLVSYLGVANALGFFMGQKVNNSSRKAYRNGALNNSTTSTDANALPNYNITISALNDAGIITSYSNKKFSFVSIGNGTFSDTDASNFSNRVNTLMTYFGINVY